MTIEAEKIKQLVNFAVDNYTSQPNPIGYAELVAHQVAADTAASLYTESADAAAFVASIKTAVSMVKSGIYSANIAIEKTKEYNQANQSAASIYASRGRSKPAITTTVLELDSIINDLETTIDVETKTNEAYFKAFSDDKAKTARTEACAIYSHAYSSAYAAYVHASAIAAQYPPGEARTQAFTHAITTRLSADLGKRPLSPGFFIEILCSDAMTTCATVLLIAGLLALTIGICGLTIPSVGSIIVAMNLNSSGLTIAGGIMTSVGIGKLTGQFFAKNKCERDNHASQLAVRTMNLSCTS